MSRMNESVERRAGGVSYSCSERSSAHAIADRDSQLRVVGGRVVSTSINDPSVRKRIEEAAAERRKSPEALRAHYVKLGFLTKTGKVTKRFGG